jgi:hypothetical protein
VAELIDLSNAGRDAGSYTLKRFFRLGDVAGAIFEPGEFFQEGLLWRCKPESAHSRKRYFEHFCSGRN